jgi:D-alanyl-D-alanine carboxypeptidase
MKRKHKYVKKKKTGKRLTITLLVTALVGCGLVAILGFNGWDIEKSTQSVQTFFGLPNDSIEQVGSESDAEGTTTGQVEETSGNVTEQDGNAGREQQETTVDAGGYMIDQQLPEEPTYVNQVLLANKKNPLPSTFAPGEDPVAREAFEKMAAEAKLSGFNLTAFSTYRSFEYQKTLYDRYVERDGKEAADTYSARPGYSEHQTGLAFDIGEVNFEKHWASSSFGETEAGKWLAANAHRFGFILRYPEGKEDVTGYMHESWHYRYVGVEIATDVYNRDITLEEYLGVK